MRYPASETAEIIQLVEQSHLPASAHWTNSASHAPHSIAGMIATAMEALTRWPIIGLDQTESGIVSPTMCVARSSTWRWSYLSCRRASWPCASPTNESKVLCLRGVGLSVAEGA